VLYQLASVAVNYFIWNYYQIFVKEEIILPGVQKKFLYQIL